MLPDGSSLHDDRTEEAVLGAMMSLHSAIPSTLDILTEECFRGPRNREIFRAVMEVYSEGDLPDPILVGDRLSRTGSEIQTSDLMAVCAENPPLPDVRSHCLILQDLSLRRRMWETAYRLLNACTDKGRKIEEIHAEAKRGIDGVFGDVRSELHTLGDTYRELQEEMLERNAGNLGITGTPTGFRELDDNGGLNGSDLIVVGAETSQGKTSFATALAMSAIEHGDHVAFYSMEMTPVQLTARIASMRSGISSKRILYQKMTMDEIMRIDRAMEGIDTGLMHFDGRSTSSLDRILMSIRNMRHRHGIRGAVVDYLQLIGVEGLTTEQTAAKCARELKNLAKELDIWIIAISQLSRNQQNPVPSLSRLRNSGQIEEAADNIFLIYRPKKNCRYPEPYAGISTEDTAMVMIAKGRHVGTDEFICGFKAENTLFHPLQEGMIRFNDTAASGFEEPF